MNPQGIAIILAVGGVFVSIIAYFLNRLINQVDKLTEKLNELEKKLIEGSMTMKSLEARLGNIEKDFYMPQRNGKAS